MVYGRNNMFRLNKAIEKWREQMLAAGIKSPEALDELESHLREDAQARVASGLAEQQAFDIAVKQIGSADALTAEFEKNRVTVERRQMIQNIFVLAALFGTVFGGSMVMPALGRWHRTGVLIFWPIVVG